MSSNNFAEEKTFILLTISNNFEGRNIDNDAIQTSSSISGLNLFTTPDTNKTKSFIDKNSNKEIKQEDINKIDLQSNCILCNSCFSSCPVYDIKGDFIGPFALSRALRYVNDEKLESNDEIISRVQKDGIWDCTLCGVCTLVCPQHIDPKADIIKLQNISIQKGYTNPNFQNFSFDYNDDFGGGFNPNGF